MAFTVTLKNKYYYSQRDLKLSDQKVWSNARVTANSIHILHLAGIEPWPQLWEATERFPYSCVILLSKTVIRCMQKDETKLIITWLSKRHFRLQTQSPFWCHRGRSFSSHFQYTYQETTTCREHLLEGSKSRSCCHTSVSDPSRTAAYICRP